MKIITIDEQKWNRKKPISRPMNEESRLYIVRNNLYKIFKDQELRLERENPTYFLMTYQPEGGCNPNAVIENKNGEFIGCSYPYLRDYWEILDIPISIERRKELALKTNKIYNSFSKQGFIYYDIHPHNLMTNGENIKFVDMDSIILAEGIDEEDLPLETYRNSKQLIRLLLSIIFGINLNDPSINLKTRDIANMIYQCNDKNIATLFEYSMSTFNTKPFDLDIGGFIESIDIEKVKYNSKQLQLCKQSVKI